MMSGIAMFKQQLEQTFLLYGLNEAAARVTNPRGIATLAGEANDRLEEVNGDVSIFTREEEIILTTPGTMLTNSIRDKFLYHAKLNGLDPGLCVLHVWYATLVCFHSDPRTQRGAYNTIL